MATVVTLQASDLITNSRADINTSIANLNSDKLETSLLSTDSSFAGASDLKIASQLATKLYVDAGGNVNASETVRGIVEEATDAEVTAGTATGATGAKLFITPTKLATRLSSIKNSFPVQDIGVKATSAVKPYYDMRMTSNSTGSVMYVGFIDDGSTTTANILRLQKDTGTNNYYITHSTTLTVTTTSFYGMMILGNYLYVHATIGGVVKIMRYLAEDLSDVTTMTISGTAPPDGSSSAWADGTQLYIWSAANTYSIYTISGTTATYANTVTLTSSGTSESGVSNGVNVWLSDSAGDGTFNIRKYAIAGGAVISTTSPVIYNSAFLNGAYQQKVQMFLIDSNTLGIGWFYNSSSDTAVTGLLIHLMGITLP